MFSKRDKKEEEEGIIDLSFISSICTLSAIYNNLRFINKIGAGNPFHNLEKSSVIQEVPVLIQIYNNNNIVFMFVQS